MTVIRAASDTGIPALPHEAQTFRCKICRLAAFLEHHACRDPQIVLGAFLSCTSDPVYLIAPSIPDPPETLCQDCEMLTWLLGRVMRDQPDLTPQVAYAEVQRRVSPVTDVQWETIELVIDPTLRMQIPVLSFDV